MVQRGVGSRTNVSPTVSTLSTLISHHLSDSSTCTDFTKVRLSRYPAPSHTTDCRPVSDVFHTGSPDSALWEFKHGNGNFKRGDLVGLREIKRRASRHALIHRDSFPGHKAAAAAAAASQPGTPAESAPDATEARLMNLEHSLYDVHNRLARAEEGNGVLSARCQALIESLSRCYQVSIQL